MSKQERLNLQVHLDGAWQDAAMVEVKDVDLGIISPTILAYNTPYFFAYGNEELEAGRKVIDWRALSVCHQVDLSNTQMGTWPPFLLDLLPQGYARQRLATELGLDPNDKATEYPLLLRSAGSPIGSLRVKEAWTAEQQRLELHGAQIRGVTTEEIFAGSERFMDMVDRFALLASGSSGVQGDWPKILLTLSGDGLWYPDSMVADELAREHVIVKMSQAKFPEDALILESEAPYLELAREFGLRVGKPLKHRNGRLMIHRFDRQVRESKVIRLGQESLVAAAGIAEFGHITTHEHYIATLKRYCTDPESEIVEYVLRDVLNRASGDTDNHGRNTALQKRPDGWIGLTPRFDFAPMAIHPSMIRPSTSWACLRDRNPDSRYQVICQAVGEVMEQQRIVDHLRDALFEKAEMVAALPSIAQRLSIPQQVIDRAFRFSEQVAADLGQLRRSA